MAKKSENTETIIINAAREVFIHKGYDGARMQEIADKAAINKSLLHYYFRSKDKLFDKVFTETFGSVINILNDVFDSSRTFEEFIENFVTGYTKALQSNPFMPNFVLHELSRNPQRVVNHIASTRFDKNKMFTLISKSYTENMNVYHPIQILVDIIALCVFPFVARPIVEGIMFGGDNTEFDSFIDDRPQHIIEFVKNAIYKKHIIR